MIVKCICICPMQDALHGAGNRVANVATKHDGKARCTKCGTLVDYKKGSSESGSRKKIPVKTGR